MSSANTMPDRVQIRWTVAIVATLGLTYLLLSPNPLWLFGQKTQVPILGDWLKDTMQHAIAYFVFTTVLAWSLWPVRARWRGLWIVLAAVHATATELLQHFVPHRYTDARDFIANAIGITLGATAVVLFVKLRGSRGVAVSTGPANL